VLAVAHSADHSISRRRQWRLEEVHDAVMHDPPASLNVVRQATAEGKRKTRRRFRERGRYGKNHAEQIRAVYVCLNTIKDAPGISALSDMSFFTELINDLTRHMSCRELGMLAGTCKEIRDASTETMKRMEVKNRVFPGDGFFDIYNADQSIQLRFFNDKSKSFSKIEHNNKSYNIDLVLFNTDAPLNVTIVNMTRFINDHMRSRVVKALWIREFECREDSVYVELAVEHPAFADVILVIDAEKQ